MFLPGRLLPAIWGQAATFAAVMLLVLTGALAWGWGLLLAALVAASSAQALRSRPLSTPDLGAIVERLQREAVLSSGSADATTVWPALTRLISRQDTVVARLTARVVQLETVLGALPDPLILLDGARTILRTNQAAALLFGSKPERLPGENLAQLLRNPDVLAAADSVIAGGPARTVELSIHQPVEREMTVRIEPLNAPPQEGPSSPEQPRALLVLHDQTRTKRTEQMRSDFVANASHELKTPLSTLIGFIETLRGPAQGDEEAQARFLSIMQEQAARMARLVEDLLSLSRIELDEHVEPTTPVRIADLVRQVVDVFEIKAAGRDMSLVLAVAPELPEVAGNADELAQLLQNLIDNALKYGRPGTAVTIAAAPSPRLPGGVALEVRDCGDGIAREHLPRLTERFYRVDTARSRAMGGTGLGLAIVKHIVNRHRGLLQIESDPGHGSCFRVHLRPAVR